MKYNFLYLDDEDISTVESYKDAIELRNKNIKIEIEKPLDLVERIKNIKSNIQSIDGLILDLRLDMKASNNVRSDYRAPTLAQEIRTRSTEKNITKEIPIVLISTEENYKKSYFNDQTGHDLFDKKYVKTNITKEAKQIGEELICLAEGYKKINYIKSRFNSRHAIIFEILKLNKKELDYLDEKILNLFCKTNKILPTHEYARKVLNDLIFATGDLVNEYIVAARLGIDRESHGWKTLCKDILIEFKYNGVFSEAWPRWWMKGIANWWNRINKNSQTLSILDASERVEIIKKKTDIKNIKSAKVLQKGYSNKYWTYCQVYLKPIDPKDGLTLTGSNKVWQEPNYISIKAALAGYEQKLKNKINPLERERLKALKKIKDNGQ